jgi:hypothetical protein
MLEKEPDKRPATLTGAVEELVLAAGAIGIPIDKSSDVTVDAAMRAATARTLQAATQQTLVGAATEVATPVARRSSRSILLASVVAVVAGAGGIYLAERHGNTVGGASPTVMPSVSASATASGTSTSQGEDVDVVVDSMPHAEIYDGAQRLGVTPFTIRLPKRSGAKTLTLKADGYVARDIDVDTSSSHAASFTLAPVSVKPLVTATSTATKKISSELEKPTF